MSDFRRWYQPGGTYFFTVVTYLRQPIFGAVNARNLLGRIMRQLAGEKPFETVAIVLFPDHLHTVWSLPVGDANFSDRWRAIKREFTVQFTAGGGSTKRVSRSQAKQGRRGIWQRRFWEHLVRDEFELETICDYIHFNPVKHGYVKRPWDWGPSTFRRFVEAGQYPRDWGRSEPESKHALQQTLRPGGRPGKKSPDSAPLNVE